jgi:hypothetical protein
VSGAFSGRPGRPVDGLAALVGSGVARRTAPSPQNLSGPELPGPDAPHVALAAAPAADDTLVHWSALGGLALLLSAAAWLAVTDRRPDPGVQEWGFGRYRGPRDGQAPSL